MRYVGCVVVLFLALTGPVRAGFDEGVAAFGRGDYVTAFREMKAPAERGLAEAQFNLGVMLAEGRGVTRNYAEAARWYRLAAEQGYIKAQFNLAVMYRDGLGVPADHAEAAQWFRRIAERGVVEAQFIIGVMYSMGDGVPRDGKEAAAWLQKAANRGHPTAQHNLAVMFAKGDGVERNLDTAEHWFRKAAERGSAGAQYNLGAMYSKNADAARDLVQAYVWYNLTAVNEAAGSRREPSMRKLEWITGQLSPQNLARARALAALWADDRLAVGSAPALRRVSFVPAPAPLKPVLAQDTVSGQVAVAAAAVVKESPVTPSKAEGKAVEPAEKVEKAEVVAVAVPTSGSEGAGNVEVVVVEAAKALLSPEKTALLSDDEIMALIIGNTMTGFTRGGWWSEYYAPDGTIRGKWRGALYLAKWKVDDGRMCFDYATDGRKFCLMLRVSDDQVFAYQEDGSGGDLKSKLLPGNPKNL